MKEFFNARKHECLQDQSVNQQSPVQNPLQDPESSDNILENHETSDWKDQRYRWTTELGVDKISSISCARTSMPLRWENKSPRSFRQASMILSNQRRNSRIRLVWARP
mmetsp:Transcript_19368/g.64083  ORF Transcript_19368/g.64083 Transcript_19368/m.64083 type:complete len:108 (-) Transcript_19368:1060-1383(-)